MAWPFTTEKNWFLGEEPTKYDNQPMDANTIIYAGCPAGFRAASSPANCVRPAVAGDVFAGFALRTADNTTASAAQPNLLYQQNYGDGTTGVNGAKVRLLTEGRIRFNTQVPDGTGTAGTITGLAGTQADIGTVIYYNGTGFTTSSAGSAIKVGAVVGVGTSLFGSLFWDLEIASGPNKAAIS